MLPLTSHSAAEPVTKSRVPRRSPRPGRLAPHTTAGAHNQVGGPGVATRPADNAHLRHIAGHRGSRNTSSAQGSVTVGWGRSRGSPVLPSGSPGSLTVGWGRSRGSPVNALLLPTHVRSALGTEGSVTVGWGRSRGSPVTAPLPLSETCDTQQIHQ